MEPSVEERLSKLQKIRVDGLPVVWIGENPVLDFDHAVNMAERANLLYRWSTDGRQFLYRIAVESPVLSCKMSEACDILCALVEDNFSPAEAAEEWEPTPEYAEELESEPADEGNASEE